MRTAGDKLQPTPSPSPALIWSLRALFVAVLMLLCLSAGSGTPALAFGLTWGPNGLFLALYVKGVLRLPRFLRGVHRFEPVIYRWLGVGWIKRIVATETWPKVIGAQSPPKTFHREKLLDQTEHSTLSAETCHGWTFLLAGFIAIVCLFLGQTSIALWILSFNIILNGYPILLQRSNRWRVHRIRAKRPLK